MDERALLKLIRTPNVKVQTLYNDREQLKPSKDAIEAKVLSDENVRYLTNMIIERADPTRNGASMGQFDIVKNKVITFLNSWKELGKFDRILKSSGGIQVEIHTVNITTYIDALNFEFINAFAERILPTSDVTKVVSVVNPGNLYVQQERLLVTTAKPVPFYEKALYKRLTDFNLNLPLDETENLFYMKDKNPRLSESERKKTNSTKEQDSISIERNGLHYHMIPKY